MKFLKGKVDEQFDLWQYDYNPLFVNTGLTNAHKHQLITQAEEQYYQNNNTDYAGWIWTYVPMHVVKRPVKQIDVLWQDGAIVLASIVPAGSTLRTHVESIDPIVPLVCGYDQLLDNDDYTNYMSDLIFEMQSWIEKYSQGNTNAYIDEEYMKNARFYATKIIENVTKSVLLSLHESVLFKKLLLLFVSNPLASLQYALSQMGG